MLTSDAVFIDTLMNEALVDSCSVLVRVFTDALTTERFRTEAFVTERLYIQQFIADRLTNVTVPILAYVD